MNNVILAILAKGQSYLAKPRIVYAYWITIIGNDLIIYKQEGKDETIPLDKIKFMSVVGQFDKTGEEWSHHDDPDKTKKEEKKILQSM